MEREAYSEMNANEDIHWWFVARRSIIKKVLDHYLRNKEKREVLEVGCGSGGNLQMLKAYGNVSALEFDDEARGTANSRNICDVRKGELPNDVPFDNGFDLVCMLDVLEHIDDDLTVLKSIADRLNAGGKLLITVPAYEFFWSEHDVVYHHKRRYIKRQLTRRVSKSGLKVKYATYFNTLLFPIVATVRILNSTLRKNSGSDVSLPSMPVSNLLAKIFSSEQVFLPTISFPFGVSILLIAEKAEDDKC